MSRRITRRSRRNCRGSAGVSRRPTTKEVFKLKTLEERVLANIRNEKDEIEIKSFTLDELETFKQNADSYPDLPAKKAEAPHKEQRTEKA